jgi:hypothetical protein
MGEDEPSLPAQETISQFGIYREKEGPVWVEWGVLFISFL